MPNIPKKLAVVGGVASAVAVVFNSWFLSFGVRTSGDWGFMLQQTADTLRRHYFSIWLSDNSFGRVLIDAGQAPSYAIYGWLSYYLGTGYALNERLIHLWPAVIGAIISSFLLGRYVFRDVYAGALSAIIYTCNTYFLALLTGHLTLAVAYALAPLVILCYLRAINNRSLLDVLLCALALAACGAYEPRSAYIIVLILMLLAACHCLLVYIPRHGLAPWGLSRLLAIYVLPLILFGLLNLYWVLGLAFAGGANDSAIESSLFGNEFFDMSSALTLFHPFWTGGAIEPFVIHTIPLYFWFIPLAAFSGFALYRRNRLLLFFMALGIIGIFLSKQSDAPLTAMYEWLFKNFPGFNAFREASKFYLLTTLSYMILIPAFFLYIRHHYSRRLAVTAFAGLSLLFLPNLLPVATNRLGATFAPKAMPAGYTQLNDFLDKADYSRVLWVPQKSRWSLVSANHPSVNASKLTMDAWKDLQGGYKETSNATPTDEINELLAQKYTPVLLANAGIKYIVVPQRDIDNADNFFRSFNDDPSIFTDTLSRADYLREAHIRIDGFKIYETKADIKPYFSSTAHMYALQSSEDLPASYNLWQKNLRQQGDFNFVITNQQGPNQPYTTDIADLLGAYDAADIAAGKLPFAAPATGKQASYFFNTEFSNATYQASSTSFTYKQQRQPAPGSETKKTTSTQTIPLQQAKQYLLKVDDTLSVLTRNAQERLLGSPRQNIQLYTVESNNLLPAPSHGLLWQKRAQDCAPYEGNPAAITMRSIYDEKLKRSVRTLSAKNHAACTTPGEVAVTPGSEYYLSFKYRGTHAQLFSYRLEYNLPGHAPITKNIAINDNQWHTFSTTLHIPEGATKLRLYLIARPSNQVRATAKVAFTDVQLAQVTPAATLLTDPQTPAPATLNRQQASYKIDPSPNLIPNGSFEHGLWKQRVGDCNNYDDQPALRMNPTGTASQGKQALQLEAKRHVACTDTQQIKVQGGATYRLQFDYQSPNAKVAGYIVTTDDPNATQTGRQLQITDKNWHTYRRTITIPQDASHLRIAVFAYSDDTQQMYNVTRYDNVVLQRVPDIADRYLMVSTPTTQHAQPRNITFRTMSNTHKAVTVTGATKPFFLLMSEQYHPAWKLMYGTIPDKSAFNYAPWKARPRLADQYHLKANGFQNAWYIDPQTICREQSSFCSQTADGSYTITFTTIFNAQRWFNFGLIISLLTGGLCVTGVAVLLVRRRAKAKQSGRT